MRVIELLNKIANGEEAPKKIKYDNAIYEYNEQYDYKNELQINYYSVDECIDFFNKVFCFSLNDEVEIIKPQEHKIPEKFKVHSLGDKDKYGNYVDSPFPTNKELMNKINEIIDCLEEID